MWFLFESTSYAEHIVKCNGAAIFALAFINAFVTKLNIPILKHILQWTPLVFFEYVLCLWCLWNIWSVSKYTVNPYVSRIHFPLQDYVLKPGPIITNIWQVYQLIHNEFLSTKKSTPSTMPTATTAETQPAIEKMNTKVIPGPFKAFMDFGRPQQETTSKLLNLFPLFTNNRDALQQQQQQQQQDQGFSIRPEDAARINLTAYKQPTASSITNIGGLFSTSALPKLKYTPCIKPPLKPTAHRERLLWFLSPTKDVVNDLRIQQILDFQKNYNKFGDRASNIYYDKMTLALLVNIFYPLQKSIDSFNALLAPKKQNVANCPPGSIFVAQLIPNFNNESVFSILEAVQFITLPKYNTPEAMEYVMERVKDLSANRKMAGYRFIPKIPGMPTDAQIIMHIFKEYLKLKEPYAIPPLVAEQGDVFKFLLIYFHITPELNHWKVFDLDAEPSKQL